MRRYKSIWYVTKPIEDKKKNYHLILECKLLFSAPKGCLLETNSKYYVIVTLRRNHNEAQEEGEGACSDWFGVALEGLPAYWKAIQMPWNVHIWEERTMFSFPTVVGATYVCPPFRTEALALSAAARVDGWQLTAEFSLWWQLLAEESWLPPCRTLFLGVALGQI